MNFFENKINKVHFIAIGGISMSGIAKILISNGIKVSGSDLKRSFYTDELDKLGAEIHIGHDMANLIDQDIVIFNSAIKEDNPEMIRAKELGIPMIKRTQAIGEIMKNYNSTIAISGTHGKTTATSMISIMMYETDFDPTIMVGSHLPKIGGNLRIGKGDVFITESCEYQENFLDFFPTVKIVLNIDVDHLDYYRDIDHVRSAFVKFLNLNSDYSHNIINGDDENIKEILPKIKNKDSIITFGFEKHNDYYADNIITTDLGISSFDLYKKGSYITNIKLSVPGKHNIYNALATYVTGELFDLSTEFISNKLNEYSGVSRRFEILGQNNNIVIIDDYAHHPAEINTTLQSIKKYTSGKKYCLFQPHTYSRTYHLLDAFAESFSHDIDISICDIYAAREKDDGIIHSKDLVKKLKENGYNASYHDSLEYSIDYYKKTLRPGDLLITMGAGNVNHVAEELNSYFRSLTI